MASGPVVAVTLAAAAAFGLSSSLKHGSAGQVPDAGTLDARRVRRLVRSTLIHPLWLGGIGADVVGLTLQIVALHMGALSLVQPLLVSGLVFALLLRQVSERRLDARALGWALLLALGLAAFVVISGSARAAPAKHTDHGPAIAAAVVGVVLVAVCVALSRREGRSSRPAAILGVAVGTTYAATAALLKTVTDRAVNGPVALLSSWELYVVLAVGGLGLLLNQLAFQAGPLTASLPAIATVDPLLSIALGVTVYDERLRHGGAASLGLAVVLLVMGAALIQLARIEAVEEQKALAADDDRGPGPPDVAGAPPAGTPGGDNSRSTRGTGRSV